MTDYEQQRYQALFEMFDSKGWSHFLEDVQHDIELNNNVLACKNAEELHFRKGILTTLGVIKGLKDNTYAQYNAAIEDDET